MDSGTGLAAVVSLTRYVADQELSLALSAFPMIGCSEVERLLFNPQNPTPDETTIADVDGYFEFSNIAEGTYFVSAVCDSYGTADPPLIKLPGDTAALLMSLVVPEDVSGTMASATWYSRRIYSLVGDVLVLPNETLTIQPGALIISAGDFTLTVAGNLDVQGEAESPVRFRLAADVALEVTRWGGIRLDHVAQTAGIGVLSRVSIRDAATALRVSGGVVQVNDSYFHQPMAHAAYFDAQAAGWLENSICRAGAQGLIADNASPRFGGNVILRTSGAAVSVKNGSAAEITGNVLQDCQTGIWSSNNSAPLIQYNLVQGGEHAIEAQNGFWATVQYNEFSQQSSICINFSVANCYPLIFSNNFQNLPQIILQVNGSAGRQADTIFARYNYWDHADAETIPSRIIDGYDIGSPSNPIGPVIFEPFYLSPLQGVGP